MTASPASGPGLARNQRRRARALAFFLMIATASLGATEMDGSGQSLGGDFTLTDQQGHPFALHDLRGKVVLLSFGYTYCPDVCPLTLTLGAQVIKALGHRGRNVVPVFVSLDPKRDTPKVLAGYVRYFHPAMIGLTGSDEQLAEVARRYKARFEYQGDRSGERYTLDHTADLYVLDTQGKVAAMVPYGLPAEHVLKLVEPLLPARP